MNQRTHAWIAIRAIKLLNDEGLVPDLVKLLIPFTKKASIGAWIPDKRDAKIGGAQTQNHVFKIGPYTGPKVLESRFIFDKTKMLEFLEPSRLTYGFLENHNDLLDTNWWNKPYKADPPPGKHLANRAMALAINNIDLLIVGDPVVQELVPGRIDFIDNVSEETRSKLGQVALFFFMLSHFVADALMPCHCDERDLSDYDSGLHKELEAHWSRNIGTFFDEKDLLESSLTDNKIIDESGSVDSKFSITFKKNVPIIKTKDIWDVMVLLCRASFTVASIIAPFNLYKYKPEVQTLAKFNDLFTKDQKGKDLLSELDTMVMHYSVLNVAMVWKDIWLKFS